MTTLLRYGASRLHTLFSFLLGCILFGLVFILYDLPLEPYFYALGLCVFFFLLTGLWDYYRFYTLHHRLTQLRAGLSAPSNLPQPPDLIAEDYTALLTQVLQENQRLHSQSLTRQADMMDYYSLWAHQIKTPIAAMGLILQTEVSHRELSEQLFRIQEYVEMVLQFIRCEGDGSDFVIVELSLDQVLRQTIRKYAKSFIRRKITVDFTQTDMTVLSDEKWLVFMVGQLLSNALKYTAPGGRVTLSSPDGLTLIIADDGMGIDAADLPRVFEKGFTGYNGRADQKSTGIGLYLCRLVADRLNHGLTIQSQMGKGTQVYLTFSPHRPTFE